MKKKLLALALCAAFIFSYVPSFATTDSSEETKVEDMENKEDIKKSEETAEENLTNESNGDLADKAKDEGSIEKTNPDVEESGKVRILYILNGEERYVGKKTTKKSYDTLDVSSYEKVQFDGFTFSHTEKKVEDNGDLTVSIHYQESAGKKYDFNPTMKLRIEVMDETKHNETIKELVYPIDVNRQSIEYEGIEVSLEDLWNMTPFIPDGYVMTNSFGPDAGFYDGEFLSAAIVKPSDQGMNNKTNGSNETDKTEQKQEDPKENKKDVAIDKKEENPIKAMVSKLPRTGVASLRFFIIAAVVLIGVGVLFTRRKK